MKKFVNQTQCEASLGTEGYCSNNTCLCKTNSGHLSGSCYKIQPLHQSCSFNEECILGTNPFAACNSTFGVCQCTNVAFELNLICYKKLAIVDFCRNDIECQLSIPGQVECNLDNLVCQCLAGKNSFYPQICRSCGS